MTRVGVLGAGQLGRMLAEAGRPLGMEFRFLDPAGEVSARGLGEHLCAAYEDIEALEQFVRGLDAITYEFENVRMESVKWLAQRVYTAPSADALRTAGDRLYEKTFFLECGIPSPAYGAVFFRDEYDEALRRIGYPAVMKTRRFGYDGKGQRVIRDAAGAETAWKDLNGIPLFLEGFVPFDREVSLVAVRARSGEVRCYPLVENHHREGILRLTIAPAPGVSQELQQLAEGYAARVMERLNYVGVLAIEFFQTGRQLLANEMAPRVHNSGHWSIEGAETSQFENHLRAVTGMELGATTPRGHSAMINVIGDWPTGDAAKVLSTAYRHDYGKTPRGGRKIGHYTLVAQTAGELMDRLAVIAESFPEPALCDALERHRTAHARG